MSRSPENSPRSRDLFKLPKALASLAVGAIAGALATATLAGVGLNHMRGRPIPDSLAVAYALGTITGQLDTCPSRPTESELNEIAGMIDDSNKQSPPSLNSLKVEARQNGLNFIDTSVIKELKESIQSADSAATLEELVNRFTTVNYYISFTIDDRHVPDMSDQQNLEALKSRLAIFIETMTILPIEFFESDYLTKITVTDNLRDDVGGLYRYIGSGEIKLTTKALGYAEVLIHEAIHAFEIRICKGWPLDNSRRYSSIRNVNPKGFQYGASDNPTIATVSKYGETNLSEDIATTAADFITDLYSPDQANANPYSNEKLGIILIDMNGVSPGLAKYLITVREYISKLYDESLNLPPFNES